MELLIAVVAGLLFSTGIYLILERQLLRVVIGTSVLSHGVNVLLLVSGGFENRRAPILSHEGGAVYADPLPQALILTAIVIGFGVTALLLVIAFRTYQEQGGDDLDELHGVARDE